MKEYLLVAIKANLLIENDLWYTNLKWFGFGLLVEVSVNSIMLLWIIFRLNNILHKDKFLWIFFRLNNVLHKRTKKNNI